MASYELKEIDMFVFKPDFNFGLQSLNKIIKNGKIVGVEWVITQDENKNMSIKLLNNDFGCKQIHSDLGSFGYMIYPGVFRIHSELSNKLQ